MDRYHFLAVIFAFIGIFFLAFGLKIRFRASGTLAAKTQLENEYIAYQPPQVYQRSGLVKFGLFLISIAAILEIWVAGIPLMTADPFPSEKEFQSFSFSLEHKSPNGVPYNELAAFLQKIRDPKDVYQAVFVEDFFAFLTTLYLKTEDQNILLAVDNTLINGNAANTVCGFYARIIHTDKVRQRYQANRLPIQRCIGLSISPEAYKKLIE